MTNRVIPFCTAYYFAPRSQIYLFVFCEFGANLLCFLSTHADRQDVDISFIVRVCVCVCFLFLYDYEFLRRG